MVPKYILVVDYKIYDGRPLGLEYKDLYAKDLYDAIEEADTYFGDDIYLLKICEKYSKTVRNEGTKATNYKAILCKRSYSGWHINNSENGENQVMVRRWDFTGGNPFVGYEIL